MKCGAGFIARRHLVGFWHALNHDNGDVIAYVFGTRKHDMLWNLLELLSNLNSNDDTGKWTNKEGEIYFRYSRENMSKIMNRTENTIRGYINELISFELIQEELLNSKSFNKSKALYLIYPIGKF